MKYETIPLFEIREAVVPIEQRVLKAVATVKRLFAEGWTAVVATSGGKDSGLVTAITLHAASEYADLVRHPKALAYRHVNTEGTGALHLALRTWRNLRRSMRLRAALGRLRKPTVIVTSSDTMVENPTIIEHVHGEFARIRAFAKRAGIRCTAQMVTPPLLSTWQVSILSGRAIPSYAGMKADCSVSYKITPQRSFRRKLFRQLKSQKLGTAVTLLGTRYSESDRRGAAMRLRGDRADKPVLNKDGEYVLSPIADLSTDDVWEAIGLYGSGVWPSYSDFQDTMRIYADAGGTSCAVVADAIFEGAANKSGKCGSRFGCWTCQAGEDKSLATMVAHDEKYAFAKSLLKINEFVRNIRYDWSRRNWVGRTIRGGFIGVGPDTFSPATVRTIARAMLQADFDEERRAAAVGERPKFQLMPVDIMIALDAMQSLYGVARPFSVWADWRDIRKRGVRYDIEETTPTPVSDLPETRFLYVGDEWDTTAGPMDFTGLRDAYLESMTELSCGPELVTVRGGKAAWKVSTEQTFTVDMESACLLMDYELDRMLAVHDGYLAAGAVTWAYKWYLQYGVITLSHSQQAEHDEVCRRTEFKDRLGLTLDYDHDALIAKSVRYRDLPENARKEWSHKATNEGSQTELLLTDME